MVCVARLLCLCVVVSFILVVSCCVVSIGLVYCWRAMCRVGYCR